MLAHVLDMTTLVAGQLIHALAIARLTARGVHLGRGRKMMRVVGQQLLVCFPTRGLGDGAATVTLAAATALTL